MHISPENAITIWNGCFVRVLVLLSASLQITLAIFGSQRKYIKNTWIKALVWSAYVGADWAATVALGNLAGNQEDSERNSLKPKNIFQAIWAPFLLMHIGGPDAIAAYALEDNDLWLRYILGVVVQVGVAFFVFFWRWSKSTLTFIAIPMFITGIIKCGERCLALWYASAKHFSQSLLPDSNPRRPLSLYTQLDERLMEKMSEAIEIEKEIINYQLQFRSDQKRQGIDAYNLFKNLTLLYAGKILNYSERTMSFDIIDNMSAEEAFNLISVELGLMYDVLYTKATVVYSGWGIFLRCLNIFFFLSALVVFSVTIDMNAYPPIDISITYILLVQSLLLEVYGFIAPLLSDWTKIWLTIQRKVAQPSPGSDSIPRVFLSNRNRWSASMGQYNLFHFLLDDSQRTCIRVQKFLCIDKLLGKYQNLTWEDVKIDLKQRIFKQLRDKSYEIEGNRFSAKLCKKILAWRGDSVLEKQDRLDQFGWSTNEVEFDHSLLLWYIATELCFYVEHGSSIGNTEKLPPEGERDPRFYSEYESGTENTEQLPPEREISKHLSNYMMYIRFIIPSMLPQGTDEGSYLDTFAEAKELSETKFSSIQSACKDLLEKSAGDHLLHELKGDIDQSVLFSGCKLARQLQELPTKEKWEMISEVWIEILTYAANRCGWKEHFQQLRRGGELLTHVRVLMAYLGLSEQYNSNKLRIRRRERTFFGDLFTNVSKDPCGKFFICLAHSIDYLVNRFKTSDV